MLTHGDLIVNNVIVTPANRLVVVDWESATWSGLPALDLVRLLYDLSLDSASVRPRARARLLADARQTIGTAVRLRCFSLAWARKNTARAAGIGIAGLCIVGIAALVIDHDRFAACLAAMFRCCGRLD